MKVRFACIVILGIIAAASPRAESRYWDFFSIDFLPELVSGDFEFGISGRVGIVGITGTIGLEGRTAPVNVGFSEIPKNVGPGLTVTMEIAKDGFFLMSDIGYAKVSPSVDISSFDFALDVEVLSTDILGGYKITHPRGSIGLFAGGRFTSVHTRMNVDFGRLVESNIATRVAHLPTVIRTPLLQIFPKYIANSPVSALFKQKIEISPGWIDLLVGARLLLDLGYGVRFAFRGEVGGLVAFMWYVDAGIDYQVLGNTSVGIEYRHRQYDYEKKGGLIFHAGITGPAIAFRIRF